jgi:flavin-binding protein dodecin
MTTNQTYVKTEVVGSNKSVSDAIESAIITASRSLRNLSGLRWLMCGVAFATTGSRIIK